MSKSKPKKQAPRASHSRGTKSRLASMPVAEQLVQLRSLLEKAGHFPRPTGRPGHRIVDHCKIPEGYEEVEFLRSGRQAGSSSNKKQRIANTLADKSGVTTQKFDAKSFMFLATDDEGADAIASAFEEAGRRRTRMLSMLPSGATAPKGWTVGQRRMSPIDAREDAVRQLREQLHAIVPALMSNGVLPSPEAWQQVLDDDLLDERTIGDAISTLPMESAPPDELIMVKQAAEIYGVKSEEMSKILRRMKGGKFPVWVGQEWDRFRSLLTRSHRASLFSLKAMRELAVWKKEALASGRPPARNGIPDLGG